MKKIALTIAIVLGISFSSFAQGGMFGYGQSRVNDNAWSNPSWNNDWTRGILPLLVLPNVHGGNQDQTAPVGSGALLLIGFGAAYAMKKRKK